jgi:hypothetical protein
LRLGRSPSLSTFQSKIEPLGIFSNKSDMQIAPV